MSSRNATFRLLRAAGRSGVPANPRQFFAAGRGADPAGTDRFLPRHYYGLARSRCAITPAARLRPPTAVPTRPRWTSGANSTSRVAQLSDEDREIIGLIHYQGLAQAEAAHLLGVNLRTVERRWQHARLRLHALVTGRNAAAASPT